MEYGSRKARVVVPLKLERNFQKLLAEKVMWECAYNHVRYLYESIKDSFAIKHDNYGGYKLIYSGIESIPGQTVLPNGPKGILQIVPEHFTDLSVIYKVSDKKNSIFNAGSYSFH